MRFKFTGTPNIRRVIGAIVWSRENNHIARVDDAELCANLLTMPGNEFEVAEDEPLRYIDLQEDQMAELAMFGVASIEGLAALNKDGITALVEFTDRNAKEIRAWVTRAKQFMEV